MSVNKYEIIDVHFHLFRDVNQADGAAKSLGLEDKQHIGVAEPLIPFMAKNGISKVIFLNIFPAKAIIEAALRKLLPTLNKQERVEAEEQIKKGIPEKLRRHNDWACGIGKQYKQLIPFIGIHPILGKQGMAEEVAARSREGVKGVKIHPGSFLFYPNDRELWPMYEKCQELGIPIISDSGPFEGAVKGIDYGEPIRFAEVLRDFPRLTLVLAHLGSAFWDERLELARQFPNVYFDTSQGFSTPLSAAYHKDRGLSALGAVRVIRKIGVERIMFGSDGPFFDPVPQLEEVLGLDLTEQEKQMILAGNARRILKI